MYWHSNSIRPSAVCLKRSRDVSKRLKISSILFHRQIYPAILVLSCLQTKRCYIISTRSPLAGQEWAWIEETYRNLKINYWASRRRQVLLNVWSTRSGRGRVVLMCAGWRRRRRRYKRPADFVYIKWSRWRVTSLVCISLQMDKCAFQILFIYRRREHTPPPKSTAPCKG